jgi:radical SAM enzyme (TIGR01210 family)
MQALNTPLIKSLRPRRHRVDPLRPHAWLIEREHSRHGIAEDVVTLFLVNSECAFTCAFCDLWKHTLEGATPPGAVPAQIDYAFDQLGLRNASGVGDKNPPPRHIKLYNSGNFFDRRAVPRQDYEAIADRIRNFETVIVENHPRLCGDDCFRFRDLIAPARLEVAMGLETIHPDVLPRLNKQMTLEDFSTAAAFLRREGIDIRAFVLLRPPWLTEDEGLRWAVQSMQFAFETWVGCCSVIPVRAGNGMMETLQREGEFSPPRLASLESALEEGLALGRGRVFADLWDAARFADCAACAEARIGRLEQMNHTQRRFPPVDCPRCGLRNNR